MMNDTGGRNKMQSYQKMSKEELYKVKEGLEKSMQNTREWVFL